MGKSIENGVVLKPRLAIFSCLSSLKPVYPSISASSLISLFNQVSVKFRSNTLFSSVYSLSHQEECLEVAVGLACCAYYLIYGGGEYDKVSLVDSIMPCRLSGGSQTESLHL